MPARLLASLQCGDQLLSSTFSINGKLKGSVGRLTLSLPQAPQITKVALPLMFQIIQHGRPCLSTAGGIIPCQIPTRSTSNMVLGRAPMLRRIYWPSKDSGTSITLQLRSPRMVSMGLVQPTPSTNPHATVGQPPPPHLLSIRQAASSNDPFGMPLNSS